MKTHRCARCMRHRIHWLRSTLTILLVVATLGSGAIIASPLPKQGGVPSPRVSSTASTDAVDAYWRELKRYSIIVAADQYSTPEADLPFAEGDGAKFKEVLDRFGYSSLEYLHNENATRDAFVTALQKAEHLPSRSILCVYFTGNGELDPEGKDLWLQLYGQSVLGDRHGVSVSEIVNIIRGRGFHGQLVLILDTCFSGQSAESSSLTLRDLGPDVTILASSSASQFSWSMKTAGTECSAFTEFLIQGLSDHWDIADDTPDGVLLLSELKIYIDNQLAALFAAGKIDDPMQPALVSNSPLPCSWPMSRHERESLHHRSVSKLPPGCSKNANTEAP